MNISMFKDCANCGACYNTCSENAISVKKDELFYRPIVDSKKCVNCGMCVKVCPVNQNIVGQNAISAYAGWHKDDKIVMESSSGGAFFGLAQSILKVGGIVYGASYSNDCKTVEFKSTDDVILRQLQKSKYVESLVEFSFKDVQKNLNDGRRVLFCGTPCQVAGLKMFLKKESELLITCDFACGGLPSHKIYEDYVSWMEKKSHSEISHIDFRPKTYGWRRYAVRAQFRNGREYNRLGVEDPFVRSFLYGKYNVRDYCLKCKFSDHHVSDITIADFWLFKELSNFDDSQNGISLLLCNTSKGENAVSSIKDDYLLRELDVKTASYNNKIVNTSEENFKKHEEFLTMYQDKGLYYTYRQFFPLSIKEKIKNTVSRKLNRRAENKK